MVRSRSRGRGHRSKSSVRREEGSDDEGGSYDGASAGYYSDGNGNDGDGGGKDDSAPRIEHVCNRLARSSIGTEDN